MALAIIEVMKAYPSSVVSLNALYYGVESEMLVTGTFVGVVPAAVSPPNKT
jgi:hypothetical protein